MTTAYDAEIQALVDQINCAYSDIVELSERQQAQAGQLNDLSARLASLAADLDVELDLTNPSTPADDVRQRLQPAIAGLSPERQKALSKLYSTAPAFPSFTSTDYFVMASVGLLAVITDMVMIGLPQGEWLISNEGKRVPVGVLAKFIKQVDVDPKGVLEKLCKVSYDISTTPGSASGMSPTNHRLFSMGHDPSPLGFIMGMIDILNGGTTIINSRGMLMHIPNGTPATSAQAALAPLLWLGHLISDISTPMGLPAPGAVLTQLLTVRIPGVTPAKMVEDPTIAKLTYDMYLSGYDFRHYLAGGVVPGLIEILIRSYVWLWEVDHLDDLDATYWSQDGQQITDARRRAKLHAMLFWTHALAAAGNAGKVALTASTAGANFFIGMRAFNRAQWEMLVLRTIEVIIEANRDRTMEQIARNRQRLNDTIQSASNFTELYEVNWDRIPTSEIVV
jgi:hypothetical protein